jgi:divalent metal cation (Fe/Co/Zn/Cd) transporter
VAAINAVIAEQPGIDKVFNIITIQLGPDTMLAAKVGMTPGMDIDTAVAHINALESTLKQRIPNLAWCFVEPDLDD